MNLRKLLLEKEGDTYEYSCAMLYFDFPDMEKIHSLIDKEDIYNVEGDRTYGLEDEFHTTLLFGLHDSEVDIYDIKQVLDEFTFGPVKIHDASLFENEDYDVLKFNVIGDNLHEVNKKLREFPHTNKFKDYVPHCTIGYLKSGTGKKYVEQLKGLEYELLPEFAVYSEPDGDKYKIDIKTEQQ